jgi:two-component system sensor histidine kinase EvgS
VCLELTTLSPLAEQPAKAIESEPLGHMLNILVVDDYPANRLLLIQQLTYLGHRVQDEQDGAGGLRVWRKESFDVVITDCNMPIMNGYELVRAIRDEEHNRGLPRGLILGFTANAQQEEKIRCKEAGMDDCLFKPISLHELHAHLAPVVPRKKTLLTSTESESIDTDHIDLSSLNRLTNKDRESTNDLLAHLASSNKEDLAKLMLMFTRHDITGLSDLAHRVKGGARIINASELILNCEALESACNRQDTTVLTAAVDALHQSMVKLDNQLEQLFIKK